jgi:hypothetical protein
MIDSPSDQAALTAGRGWRARLWIPRAALECRDRDDQARLWLLLDDGRVLVFRFVGATPDDALLDALAQSLADDARGDLLEVGLAAPVPATFLVLYGAPASPVFCVDQANPIFGAALAFHACLDGAVLAALAGLVGANTFWASARNYNRLAVHPRRRERLQALARFPFLVAPILLTRQRWPNLFDAKRYRWRAHDATVVEAIEQGRDLIGALAACYGISRGLVRSPMCATPWVASTGLALADFLKFVDAIPPNRRPLSVGDVDVFSSHLPALWGLFGRHVLAGAGAFRAGYVAVWQTLEQRFPALNESLVDAGDYLRVLVRWLLAIHRRRIDPGRLAALWAGERGLASLLLASARWHAFRQRRGGFEDPDLPGAVPAILGEWREGVWQARELATRESLAEEGLVMCHCVADYWEDCVRRASRIFALESGAGSSESGETGAEPHERATALFEDEAGGDLPRYGLAQLRGPNNVPASEAMQVFARRVARELNAPLYAERRALARQAARDAEKPNRQPVPDLDGESIAALTSLLGLPPRPAETAEPGEGRAADRLRAPVAGYAHVFDQVREAHFAVGQTLDLIREPENPHDRHAIRIEWRGEKVGYVPRPDNAAVAEHIDSGATFAACICDFVPQAPPWQRLWFEIVREGDG